MTTSRRREFTKLILSVLPGVSLVSKQGRVHAIDFKGNPNSKVAGVQLGLNVPYSFGNPLMVEDDILKLCVQLGISSLELRTHPVEAFLGIPPIDPAKTRSENSKELQEWRNTVPLDRIKELRAKYEDAGVLIEIVKVDGLCTMSNGEIDYAFALAKALGGRAISTEISHKIDELERVGRFSEKHQFMVGFHNHATTKPEHWEAAFALSRYNGANLDLGHFVAGNNTSPVPFLQQYYERVTHVHLKDRKFNNGPSVPFGEGDAPIAEVLRLIRDNKWNIQGTVEFEYAIPAGSNRMRELIRSIQFCRDALF